MIAKIKIGQKFALPLPCFQVINKAANKEMLQAKVSSIDRTKEEPMVFFEIVEMSA